jgi:hypothetical protein
MKIKQNTFVATINRIQQLFSYIIILYIINNLEDKSNNLLQIDNSKDIREQNSLTALLAIKTYLYNIVSKYRNNYQFYTFNIKLDGKSEFSKQNK